MAIAVVYRVPAMSAEQYKESWSGGAPLAPPPGLIFHAGIGEETDFFTVSVWESRDAYDAFAPLFAKTMKELGLQFGHPQILPVHRFLPAEH
jgi:heme-degrading monooxygenase HmoA